MIDYVLILSRRFKDNQFILNGDDYDGLVWLSDKPKPTKKQLDDLWNEVLAEIAAEKTAKEAKRQELLDRLGITEEEAKLLLA